MSEVTQKFDENIRSYKLLAAELTKIPPERIRQVDERLSIFVSGLEAGARLQQTVGVRPTA